MLDITNIIELVHKYDTTSNVNKKKEILKILLENFKKCESDINNRYKKILKQERDINEKQRNSR